MILETQRILAFTWRKFRLLTRYLLSTSSGYFFFFLLLCIWKFWKATFESLWTQCWNQVVFLSLCNFNSAKYFPCFQSMQTKVSREKFSVKRFKCYLTKAQFFIPCQKSNQELQFHLFFFRGNYGVCAGFQAGSRPLAFHAGLRL